ncbi:MAG: hypothetical protein A2V70_05740 [Planctomycetes bacterium RBG_13_63_9]|nr:MAG: hypothetical protein A2V70_05740 [Planctomycetes bacterium RBG_13_63_9]
MRVSGDQDWTLGWKYDVQAKGAGDLEFRYGTSGGVIAGNVLYVVPEPGTLLLLACGAAGLLLWWRRRMT